MVGMSEKPTDSKLPSTYKEFVSKYPELGKAHEDIARAVAGYGPLDPKTMELIKIGLSVGAGLETATRSHVRRAMQHGATEQEVEQAILLSYNTVGWPRMVAAWNWAREQFARNAQDGGGGPKMV
jgi:4-carboxymuconolactone decarboxylase